MRAGLTALRQLFDEPRRRQFRVADILAASHWPEIGVKCQIRETGRHPGVMVRA